MKEKKQPITTAMLARLGILGALALVLSFLETVLLPDLPLLPPGAKLGLSNVVTMLTCSLFGAVPALYITALKVLFALITRGVTAAMMSGAGGVLATLGMILLLRTGQRVFSYFGVGVLCAVLHNAGQLLCACLLTGSVYLLHYGKYLLLFAIFTGSLTGLMLNVVMPRLRQAEGNSQFAICNSQSRDER